MDLLNLNLTSPHWSLMLPQLIVFGLAIVLLLGDAFLPKRWHYNGLTAISLIGYAVALVALYWQDGKNEYTFNGMFHADGLTVFLSVVLLCTAILSVMVSASYVEHLEGRMPIGEFFAVDELAEACDKRGDWTFFFTSAPLNLPGGVGSPNNAYALL